MDDEILIRAIEALRKDIVRIEECDSIHPTDDSDYDYVNGPRDIIHERLDGLIVHVGHLIEPHERVVTCAEIDDIFTRGYKKAVEDMKE